MKGFEKGFPLCYEGDCNVRKESQNLPFRVGTPTELWNKLMKEVKLKRVAGPFKKVPFKYYVRSLIGLVPKAGNKTRLIFHLSHPRGVHPLMPESGKRPVW